MTDQEFHTKILSYHSQIRAFAYSLLKDRDNALDLVQDTYYKALKYKNLYTPQTNLKAWLFTICKNSFINLYRKTSKVEFTDISFDNVGLIVDKGFSNPHLKVCTQELEKFIDQLDPIFNEPFQMFIDGYKYEEISQKLNVKLGTVKSRIFFARQKLMDNIKNDNLKTFNSMEKTTIISQFRDLYHELINKKILNKSDVVKETGLFWTTLTPILTEADMTKLVLKMRDATFVKMQLFINNHTVTTKELKVEENKPQERNECPHNHKFGYDLDEFRECDTCPSWEKCDKAFNKVITTKEKVRELDQPHKEKTIPKGKFKEVLTHKGNEEKKEEKQPKLEEPLTKKKIITYTDNDDLFWQAMGIVQKYKPGNVKIRVNIGE